MKFSVIIPAYNRATHVMRAIDSVLKQSYHALEVILIDDGSTDNTAALVQAIPDPRIHYVYQENKERGAARNAGMNIATGDYITFLDSDDEFLYGHLEQVAAFIRKNPGFGVYCTAYLKAGARGTEKIHIPSAIGDQLADGNFLSCNGVFISREIAAKYRFHEDRRMAGLEDWEFWLRIGAHEKMTGAQLFTTRMNDHDHRSVLQTEQKALEERFDIFFGQIEKNPALRSIGKRIRTSSESYMALHLALTKKYRSAARSHLWKAFRLDPGIIFTRRFYAILKHLL